MLVLSRPMVFGYHSTLALRAEYLCSPSVSPSWSIAFLLSFRLYICSSPGLADYIHVLESATALSESGFRFP